MLWKFGFASASNVDAILSREVPPSVEELMDEQEILNECKAQNNRLINYLSKEDSIKSLLQWVIAGLDELDQQAALADSACFDYALASPALYPSYQHHNHANVFAPVPGPGPNSPPLEPKKTVEESADTEKPNDAEEEDRFPGIGLGEGLVRTESASSDSSRSRYPQVATEILTSELWTISETIMSNRDALLRPFWDAVLPPVEPGPTTPSTDGSLSRSRIEQSERERARDEFWSEKDEERDKKREVIRGMWTRVNGNLMSKRTHEMIRFIQSIPNVVERLVAQIASPAIQDILIRIVSAEEAGVSGVIEWLANEGLVPQLLELLSPEHTTTMHSVASELLKSIITLCAPAPFNPNGGNTMGQASGQGAQQPGTRDNRMIRELVSETSINTMVGYMLNPVEYTDKDWAGINGPSGPPHPRDPFVVHPLPSIASASSSLSHICNILVEIIRRNNSDFSEPHLFHTLRHRLTLIQQQQILTAAEGDQEDKVRKDLEDALEELSGKMGIVHLGHLITVLSDRFAELHRLLIEPRSQARAASAHLPKPLTLERFRVVELYAELLHSSNMSILNRQVGTGPSYTSDGILSGGLAGVEALGEAVESERNDEEGESEIEAHVTPARELPVSSASTDCSFTGSEEASVDEDMLEQIDKDATPSTSPAVSRILDPSLPADTPNPPPASQADDQRLRAVRDMDPPSIPGSSVASDVGSVSHAAVAATTVAPSIASEPEVSANPAAAPKDEPLPPGDRLKQMYIKHRVLPDVVDLFFEYPQNDFMHHVVYDLLQQILNGRLGPGLNRELVIELLREAKLIERILDAQRLNDEVVKQKNKPRLPYMGHIILIAEELVKFLARCPPDLYDLISSSFVQSEWEAFVEGRLRETKDRDARPLAGGKPMGAKFASSDDAEKDDSSSDEDEEPIGGHKFGEPLTRTSAQDGFVSRTGYDSFAERDEDDEFWSGHGNLSRRHVDSSDDDDDDADWLRPSSANLHGGSDDEDFGAFQNMGPNRLAGNDDFDDDGWGTFTSPSNDNGDNPFGDDNFAPSVTPAGGSGSGAPNLSREDPLTPHDWASAFDREFEDGMAIVVPDDEEVEEPRSGWTFNGSEDQGEDLPPSPSFEDVPIVQPTAIVAPPKLEVKDNVEALGEKTAAIAIRTPRRNSISFGQAIVGSPTSPLSPIRSPTSPTATRSGSHSPSSPITIPRRVSATDVSTISLSASSSSPTWNSSSPSAFLNAAHAIGEAYSPPSPSLINATSEDRPLGPGVSRDTHVTSSGMLEKEVNGEKVIVPADEVVRGVEEAMKGEREV